MEIAPNSTIRFLKGVPLDKTMQNTIMWFDKNAQTNYFLGKTKASDSYSYIVNESYYQRYNKGTLRVQIPFENLYDCNYIMFKNTSFEDKWFYAFITDVTYVSNDVTTVEYLLDVMQTWFFDYTLQQCFVEREHVDHDYVSGWLQPESLETGDYIVRDMHDLAPEVTTPDGYMIMATESPTGEQPDPDNYKNNMYAGVYIGAGDNSWIVTAVRAYQANAKLDALVSINQIPTTFVSDYDADAGYYHTSVLLNLANLNFYTSDYTNVWGGYVPHNKKLFTYPYSYMTVTNWEGDTVNLRYERFNNPEILRFGLLGAYYPNPEALLFPKEYAQNSLAYENENYAYSLMIKNYAVCACANDYFGAWWAQNRNSLSTAVEIDKVKNETSTAQLKRDIYTEFGSNALTGVFGKILSGLKGAGNTALSGMNSLADAYENNTLDLENNQKQLMATKADHDAVPNSMATQAGSTSIFNAIKRKKFTVQHMTITTPYLKAIDQYFDMYGYASNQVKVPNRAVRPHYTYCKTNGCVITGNFPADHEEAIQKVYDNGIRFWLYPDEIGDYTVDNRPIY